MPYFNRFDICEAYYKYAVHYHTGQFSWQYKILGRLQKIGFKPSYSLKEHDILGSENSDEIYDNLVSNNQGAYKRYNHG